MEQTNLTLKRGDSKTYTLSFVDNDNAAIDITGWTVFFTTKENIDDTDGNAKIKKTITSHYSPTSGISKIELTSADTDLVGNYIYDIQVKTDDDEILTMMEGIISFAKDVTQRTS